MAPKAVIFSLSYTQDGNSISLPGVLTVPEGTKLAYNLGGQELVVRKVGKEWHLLSINGRLAEVE